MHGLEDRPFPNPDGKINVLKRYLHILALLQYIPDGEKPETWNARSLADILSLEEDGQKPPDDSLVRSYIKHQIEDDLGISVDRMQGGSFTTLAEDLDVETQLKIARVYADFVIKDTTKDMILKKFIEAMPKMALWTIARIYFAIIEQRRIRISYTTNAGHPMKDKELCPCYMIFRGNNLYLVVWDPSRKKHLPLLADRIYDLHVMDYSKSKEWKIIPAEVLFKESLSVYITEEPSTPVTIKYRKNVKSTIEGIISLLDHEIITDEKGDYFEATFNITDYLYLCKQLVIYGSDVEIISPPKVRNAMVSMLKTSLGVYEK